MTFLPIVERELRVAARKRWTFWLRVCVAGVALIIGAGFVAIMSMPFSAMRISMGETLFAALTWICLAGVLCAGLFFTSDCLSEEKREGTLGFLFLTDLRGYDVVLGKLLTTSLRGSFAVLAIFPVLAVTFVMGGVQADYFWKALLALLNTLFFSLAAGMFVSAISRDSQKAMGGTLFLLLFFIAGLPAIDSFISWITRGEETQLTLLSPAYAFYSAKGWKTPYWNSLVSSHVIAWLFLATASFLIPRNWQVSAKKAPEKLTRFSKWWRYGGPRRVARLRRKFLEINPVLWLAARERWQALAIWIAFVLALSIAGTAWLMNPSRNFWMMWGQLGGFGILLLYLWTASQATRFLSDARGTGVIELLLATPLRAREILLGPWGALWRLLGPPFLLITVTIFFVELEMYRSMWGGIIAGTSGGASASDKLTLLFMATGMAALGCIKFIANVVALCWFGFWMAMTSRSANIATLKTIAYVQIIPWFAIMFTTYMLLSLAAFTSLFRGQGSSSIWMLYFMPIMTVVVPGILILIKDAALFFWARQKLMSGFREMAVRAVAPIKVTRALSPQPLPMSPPVPPAPPVMPAHS